MVIYLTNALKGMIFYEKIFELFFDLIINGISFTLLYIGSSLKL